MDLGVITLSGIRQMPEDMHWGIQVTGTRAISTETQWTAGARAGRGRPGPGAEFQLKAESPGVPLVVLPQQRGPAPRSVPRTADRGRAGMRSVVLTSPLPTKGGGKEGLGGQAAEVTSEGQQLRP